VIGRRGERANAESEIGLSLDGRTGENWDECHWVIMSLWNKGIDWANERKGEKAKGFNGDGAKRRRGEGAMGEDCHWVIKSLGH